MNRNNSKYLLAALLAACAALALWLMRSGSAPGNAPAVAQKAAPSEKAVSGNGGEPGPVPEYGTPEFNRYVLERCARWLESRKRDAAGLVAAWDMTGDPALLDEAAEKFPDDPRVCIAMINRLGITGGAALWVDRFIKAEPGNPAGLYWKARLLQSSGKPAEAIEALRSAVTAGGKPDDHLRERMTTVREAALSSGASIKEAAIIALTGPLTRNGAGIISPDTFSLLRGEIKAAKASGDSDRVADIAALGAASAEHLGMAAAPTLMNDLLRVSLQSAMLAELDAQTEFGNDGKTVGTRLGELEAEREAMRKLLKPVSAENSWERQLNSLDDAEMSGYADRFILNGESAAQNWLRDAKAQAERR